MFFQKKASLNLTKLYFIVDPPKGVDFDWISKNLFEYCIRVPAKFAINYAADKDISKFRGSANESRFENLEITDATGNIVITIGKRFIRPERVPIFQCMVIGHLDKRFLLEQDMIARFGNYFNLNYAYSRILRDDYHPSSETIINKGFFSIEVETEKPGVWLLEPDEMDTGSVKGIYPVNYWRSVTVQKLKGIGLQFPDLPSDKNNIYFFNEKQQEEIVGNNPKFTSYIRFDDLGTK